MSDPDTRYIANVTRAEDLTPDDVVQLTAHGPKLTVGNAWVEHGTNDNPCVGLAVTGRADWLYLPLGTYVKVVTVRGPSGQEDPAEAAYHQGWVDGYATGGPMTTVLPDGTARRVVPHGSWLTKRNPDGSLHCNHSDRDHCRVQGHETEITYRLASIEEAPDA